MSVQVVIYLNFRGEAHAALKSSQAVFGSDLVAVTYEDIRNVQALGDARLVMWGQSATAGGFKLMAFDAPAAMPFDLGWNASCVAARFDSTDQAQAREEMLTARGSVRRELAPAPARYCSTAWCWTSSASCGWWTSPFMVMLPDQHAPGQESVMVQTPVCNETNLPFRYCPGDDSQERRDER